MSVHVRPACLQDGVAVLNLLEDVGYYPEPISFAKTYRKTLADPHFLLRVAEVDGKIYSLTLNTPLEFSDKLTVEGEKFVSSLTSSPNPIAQPANK